MAFEITPLITRRFECLFSCGALAVESTGGLANLLKSPPQDASTRSAHGRRRSSTVSLFALVISPGSAISGAFLLDLWRVNWQHSRVNYHLLAITEGLPE